MTAQDRKSWRRQCRHEPGESHKEKVQGEEQKRKRKADAHAGVGTTALSFKCDMCRRTFRRTQTGHLYAYM